MSAPLVHSRCPGKLILSGEHATVYGKNAVAITVDLYTEVKICATDEQIVTLSLRNFNFETCWQRKELQQICQIVQDENFIYNEHILETIKILLAKVDDESRWTEQRHSAIRQSCVAFLLLYLSIDDVAGGGARKCFRVEVSGTMPSGAGLGSSSSYIVSLAKALFAAYQKPICKKRFNQWCYEMDKLFHGKPSGIDNSICTYGGAILFGSGQIIESIESEDLLDLANTPVLLVNTNVHRNTKTMVEKCRRRLEAFPQIGPLNAILDSIANISQAVWHALKSKNLKSLPVLFEMNQNLLNCLDVGHEKIEQIVAISKKYGLSAKLTGAGGGGIVLIYLSDAGCEQEDKLVEELHAQGFTCHQVKLGVPGCDIL